jgi:hypothetical protein
VTQQIRPHPRTIALAAVAAWLVVACTSGQPPITRMAAEVARLGAAVSIVEELRVTDFEDSPYCRNLGYARGAFGHLEQDGCEREGTGPFDAVALADHARLAQAIEASGVATDRIRAATDGPDGDLEAAYFVLDAPSVLDSWEYLYDPAGVVDTTDVPGSRDFTRIDDDWWFVGSPDD